MVHILAENACFQCVFGHFHLNMTYSKEKSIVNCAGKCNVSAKETMPKHSSIIIRAQALSERQCGVPQKVVAAYYGISVKTLRRWEINFFQFEGLYFDGINFPGSTVNFCLKHIIHNLKAFHVEVHLRYLGPFLLHPWRNQNFAGKFHNRSYNI